MNNGVECRWCLSAHSAEAGRYCATCGHRADSDACDCPSCNRPAAERVERKLANRELLNDVARRIKGGN
ncbi:unnamed protein product [Gemmata massiliana]|uniref:Uncharacterized protein n=1 Tax=Gemmata massiliana TaxID=1210884 RepID=A0A6P2D1U2_9BACT|nr:hypothetical protein [Gemmata massiliana]VTR95251.1 unnamed protein product [Gemmata massiliana]